MTSTALAAAELIKARNTLGMIETAVILGRNFYGLADIAENVTTIPYAELPGFPCTAGHENDELLICTVDGAPVLLLKGRSTFYETGDPSLMAGPIETLAMLGVRNILCTSLALSVHADLVPSSVVAITDHINFTGLNPLVGGGGEKCVINMNDAYDKRLLRRLKTSAASAGVSIHEGVFMWFSGPSYETPAEVKVARQLGADLLGWAMAPEAILARRFAVPFAGIVVVTDFGAGFLGGMPSADSARGSAVAGMVAAKRLLRAFVKGR